jgi:predicted methyltransferase MtxX (methanogen marker protein 4)
MSEFKNHLKLVSGSTLKKSAISRPKVDSITAQKKQIVLNKQKEESIIKIKSEIKENKSSVDNDKRLFLKFAGVAGLGIAASALFPNQADAYVAGSTPTSNVVGLKDSSNARIDPATEATLALIQAKTANLTFDGSNNLLTSSSGGASSVTIKDTTNTQVNPATDDSAMLLRRLVKQVDSLAVVDSAQRQKVTIDSISGSLTLGTITIVGTLTSATNLVALGGVDGRYLYIDTARNASANGIRNNLAFS